MGAVTGAVSCCGARVTVASEEVINGANAFDAGAMSTSVRGMSGYRMARPLLKGVFGCSAVRVDINSGAVRFPCLGGTRDFGARVGGRLRTLGREHTTRRTGVRTRRVTGIVTTTTGVGGGGWERRGHLLTAITKEHFLPVLFFVLLRARRVQHTLYPQETFRTAHPAGTLSQ